MLMDYESLMRLSVLGEEFSYTETDAMLYALSVGMGRDPLDTRELRYVFEGGLRVMPSMAAAIAFRQDVLGASGMNRNLGLHGEQRLRMHRPLPAAGTIIADSRVVAAYDKGPGKGAVILLETELRDKASGALLYTTGLTAFARGDGGFGGPSGNGPAPHPIPQRAPDAICELATRPDQALLYRLNGDHNPIHADPELSRQIGFERPILHGLCSYGIAGRAVLKTMCDYEPTRLLSLDVRFSSPVTPGETIVTELWRDGDIVSFQCRSKERGELVIRHGRSVVTD